MREALATLYVETAGLWWNWVSRGVQALLEQADALHTGRAFPIAGPC